MSDIYGFTYSRPASGDHGGYAAVIGALKDLFSHATYDCRGQDIGTGYLRLSSGFFFAERDFIKSFYKKVDIDESATKGVDHLIAYFSDVYDVRAYNPRTEDFLNNLDSSTREAIEYILSFYVEDGRPTYRWHSIQDQGNNTDLVKAMGLLIERFDLADPRLTYFESLYNNKDKIRSIFKDRAKIYDAATIGRNEFTRSDATLSEQLVSALEERDALNDLKRYMDAASKQSDIMKNMYKLKGKVASTFLHSRVTSRLSELTEDSDQYRQQLSIEMSEKGTSTKRTLLNSIRKHLGIAGGPIRALTTAFAPINLPHESQQHLNQIKDHAERLANDFNSLAQGSWAEKESFVAINEYLASHELLNDCLSKTASALQLEEQKTVILTPEFERFRLSEIYRFYFQNDLSEDEQSYLNKITRKDLADWSASQSLDKRIEANLRLIKLSEDACASAPNMERLSLHPNIKSDMHRNGIVISQNAKGLNTAKSIKHLAIT